MRKSWLLVGVLVASAAIAASRSPSPSQATGRVEPEPPVTTEPTHVTPDDDEPPSVQQPSETALSGEVLETIPAGNYVYLRIRGKGREFWAAVPMAEVALHSTVSLVGATEMRDFVSKTLNRTFSVVYFGNLSTGVVADHTLAVSPTSLAGDASEGLPPGHPPIAGDHMDTARQLPPGHPPIGASDTSEQTLPPGHPSIDGN